MNRKLCLLALAIVILAASAGVVQASINLSISVISNGVNLETQSSVPLNTLANVTVYYSNTNHQSAFGVLVAWYRASSSGSWKPQAVLLFKAVNSGETDRVLYRFQKPGYCRFTWTVLGQACQTRTIRASVGPVLPEPATLAGLAVSIAALGLVFTKKHPTK